MRMTEQMIIEEARQYMQPAKKIQAEKPMKVKQQRIILSETGMEYDVPQIGNRKELEHFCQRLNASECFEKFSIIAVNSRCIPTAVYSIQGSLCEVNAYPRGIVTFALLANAHSVFFTHNHPGGTCAPSAEDIKTTILMKRTLETLGIRILDHLITTPEGGAYSMAQHGDI